MDEKIGKYSFIVGVVISVILGLGISALESAKPILTSLLVLLGLVVGFMNVAGKQTKEFLVIAAILAFASYAGGAGVVLGSVQFVGKYLTGMFNSIMVFLIPAVIVVGLKAIYYMAEKPAK